MRSALHRKRFMRYVKELPVPKRVSYAHLHSAPPCGRACSLAPLNSSKGAQFAESADDFFDRLRWTRQVHAAFARTSMKKRIAYSNSHEQSDTCRLQFVSKKQKGWPWALTAHAAQLRAESIAVVHGCAFGMPVKKKWRFESNNPAMIKVLRNLVCPGCKKHQKLTSWNGCKGIGTKNSERYPRLLGRVLAEVITREI